MHAGTRHRLGAASRTRSLSARRRSFCTGTTLHLTGGKAVVDLDAAAGLPPGTFGRIGVWPQAFVQNLSGWEPLRTVWREDGMLEILSRTNDDAEVAWLVVADRARVTGN